MGKWFSFLNIINSGGWRRLFFRLQLLIKKRGLEFFVGNLVTNRIRSHPGYFSFFIYNNVTKELFNRINSKHKIF